MADVKVKATGDLMRVFIDGIRLRFSGATASKEVSAGEHVISWVARGAPGSSFSVAITAPTEATFSKEAKLDTSMLDAGVHFFQIN
jgi:hypothetical protein